MADTQMEARCLSCGHPLGEGKAVFVGVVNLTSQLLSGMLRKRALEEGRLRIQHRSSAKPRGLLHSTCWDRLSAGGFRA